MVNSEQALTNHEVTICLAGGAVLGPFNASWTPDEAGDVRDLVRDYESFLQGEEQQRFRFFLHDAEASSVHTLILDFEQVSGIYDHVRLRRAAGR